MGRRRRGPNLRQNAERPLLARRQGSHRQKRNREAPYRRCSLIPSHHVPRRKGDDEWEEGRQDPHLRRIRHECEAILLHSLRISVAVRRQRLEVIRHGWESDQNRRHPEESRQSPALLRHEQHEELRARSASRRRSPVRVLHVPGDRGNPEGSRIRHGA